MPMTSIFSSYCTCDSFNIFYLFIYLFLILFMAVLGLRFCARAFSSCGKRGPLFIAVRGSLTIVASLVAESTGSRRAGSVVVAHGPCCSAACGIFPDQGSNPCPLHWQADSQPLRHQGSPQWRALAWLPESASKRPLLHFPLGSGERIKGMGQTYLMDMPIYALAPGGL